MDGITSKLRQRVSLLLLQRPLPSLGHQQHCFGCLKTFRVVRLGWPVLFNVLRILHQALLSVMTGTLLQASAQL